MAYLHVNIIQWELKRIWLAPEIIKITKIMIYIAIISIFYENDAIGKKQSTKNYEVSECWYYYQ